MMTRLLMTRLLQLLLTGVLVVAGVGGGLGNAGAFRAAAGPTYTLTDLGAIADFPNTAAVALNAKGLIVGQSYFDLGTTDSRATVYKGGRLRILIKGGTSTSAAQDVNASGQVVGFARADEGFDRAMLWDGDEATNLGDLGGDSFANAINDAGEVVGYSTIVQYSGDYHPFVWHDGEMTALALLPDSDYGFALNINADGRIVGLSSVGPMDHDSGTTPKHAVSWVDGEITDLGTIGGDFSLAAGINAAGQIVGWSTTDADQTEYGSGTHATLWDGADATDLGTLLDGEVSAASAINKRGDIVGRSTLAPGDAFGENHAVLWHDGEILDLNDLVEGGGDAILANANDINDKGLIIAVGKVEGVQHAYLLKPVAA